LLENSYLYPNSPSRMPHKGFVPRILRSWDDVEKLAETIKLDSTYILELYNMRIQVKAIAFLARERICALGECSKVFAPVQKNQIYCAKKCNVRSQGLKRSRRLYNKK
jgi:hypothetical protein